MTPQEKLDTINSEIEQLRKRKEDYKKNIITLQEWITNCDIEIRDRRQLTHTLELEIQEEREQAKQNMTIEKAKQVLSKYSDEEYKQAVEIYFKVIHAKKTLKGLESNNGI